VASLVLSFNEEVRHQEKNRDGGADTAHAAAARRRRAAA